MKLKSDPRTNTEEQINTQHIKFTFCKLHYVKCNKLWNVYAGFFHCFCWIGFRRQKICTRTKIRGNICSRLHLLTEQRFFFLFSPPRWEEVLQTIRHTRRVHLYCQTHSTDIYKSYQTICCCRVAANSWSSDGMTIRCLALL